MVSRCSQCAHTAAHKIKDLASQATDRFKRTWVYNNPGKTALITSVIALAIITYVSATTAIEVLEKTKEEAQKSHSNEIINLARRANQAESGRAATQQTVLEAFTKKNEAVAIVHRLIKCKEENNYACFDIKGLTNPMSHLTPEDQIKKATEFVKNKFTTTVEQAIKEANSISIAASDKYKALDEVLNQAKVTAAKAKADLESAQAKNLLIDPSAYPDDLVTDNKSYFSPATQKTMAHVVLKATEHVNYVKETAAPYLSFITEKTAPIVNPICEAAKPLTDAVSSAAKKATETLTSAQDVISNGAAAIRDTANSAATTVSDTFNASVQKVTDTGAAISDGISNTFNAGVQKATDTGIAIRDGVLNTVNAAVQTATDTGTAIRDGVSNTFNAAVQTATDTGAAIRDGVSSTFNAGVQKATDGAIYVRDTAHSATTSVSDALGSAAASLKQAPSKFLNLFAASNSTAETAESIQNATTPSATANLTVETPISPQTV